MMRRFELIEGASSKFWEVDIADADLTVRFGRIGTAGQSKTKTFADQAAAQKEQDKLIKEKTGKGYAEVAVAASAALAKVNSPAKPEAVARQVPETAPAAPLATLDSACGAAPAKAQPQSEQARPDRSTLPADPAAPQSATVTIAPVAVSDSPIQWPQGGFQWTDELRAGLPCVRGRHTRPLPDPLVLLNEPVVFEKADYGFAIKQIADIGLQLGQTWTNWSPERFAQALQPESLGKADRAFWLELCAQALFMPVRKQGDTTPQGFVARGAGTRWVIWVGCHLHGLPFMLDVALQLVRITETFYVFSSVTSFLLHPLRELIATCPDAPHDEAVAWLTTHADALPLERQVRAFLCPHRTDWALACIAEKAPHWAQFVRECALPVDAARGALKEVSIYVSEMRGAVLLQLHLHGEGAWDLLADVLRRADGKDNRDAWLELAMRLHCPRLPALLITQFERSEVRVGLDKLAEQYPAAVLLTMIEQAQASRSRAMQGWAVRMALREPAALAQALPHLGEAARKAFVALLDELQATEAEPDQLPALLRQPPWLGKARATELPTLAVLPQPLPDRIEWSEAERARYQAYQVNQWLLKRLPQIDPEKHILNELRITTEAQLRVLAGQPVQPQDVVPVTHFYGQPIDMALLLPDAIGLNVWNSYPVQHWYSWDNTQAAMKALLARHGEAALPGLVRYTQSHAEDGLSAAMGVDSPQFVPLALHALRNLKKAKPVAMQWLRTHLDTALKVALPSAFAKDKVGRDNAQFGLRWLCANGFESQALVAAASYGPEMSRALQALLDADPLLVLPSRMPKLPGFFVAPSFKRPMLQGSRTALPTSAMEHLASMLAISKLDAPYAGLDVVRQLCTPASLADFAWDLFEAWLLAGAPSKEAWAFTALGLLGNDDTARRLAPRIREWPGEAAHQRAVTGLDLLAAIGTDAALMYLNGIASKVKFKGLQDRAREKIAAVAEARGLSAVELADRLVPDLGLDEQGAMQLDFGPRQFYVAFDETLKPFVKDAQGLRLKDLPKPNKADDAELAEAACERYKLLKKDAKATASLQVVRLELAMVDRRRWPAADFQLFFLDHPLMRHLAARLVWGVYGAQGPLQSAFRIAEDGTLADADDSLFELTAEATVGIAHVLDMPQPLQAAMGQILADYEIMQPFKQLGRETYALTVEERQGKALKRYAEKVVATGSVMGLINRGWERGDAQDSGWVGWFTKRVGDMEVELQLDPGTVVGDLSFEPKQSFPAIVLRQARTWGDDGLLSFDQLDPILASEVLRDVALLAPYQQ